MVGHRPCEQDALSHLFARHEICAGSDVAGRKIAIERLELHLGQPAGVRLERTAVHALSAVRRRRPIFVLPAQPPPIFDRTAELETLRQSVLAQHVVDLYGLDGVGKSTLAATLVHELDLNQFPDGAVFISGRLRCEDLLQALFDSFFESDVAVKITPQHSQSYLRGLRVLVILDDVGMGPKQIDPVLDALYEAGVLIIGPERTAIGRGRGIPVKGLPRQEAVSLFGNALGRTPSSNELSAINELCGLLNDMPLSISSVAALASQSEQSLESLLTDLEGRKQWASPGADPSIGPALEQSVLFLDTPERQLLTLVAAFAGPCASSEAIRSLMSLPDGAFHEQVQKLQRLRLLHVIEPGRRPDVLASSGTAGPRLALATAFHPAVRTWLVEDAVRMEVVGYFATRISQGDRLPGAELPGLLGAIEDCARNGWLDHLLPMVHAADRVLAELCWWAEWQHVLDLTRRAAQAGADRELEAWATHQLGSVSGALGDFERAFHLLRTALNMREALGNQAGAALTAHNLELLELLAPAPAPGVVVEPSPSDAREEATAEPAPAPSESGSSARRFGATRRLRLALLAAAAFLIVGALTVRFVVGVGANKRTNPGLTVSWEFRDAWNALDNETWTQEVEIVAEGGGGDYRYFVDGKPSEKTFEVVLPLCEGGQGTIRVESETGESAEAEFAFDSPFCR